MANAVRDELVIAADRVEDPEQVARRGLTGPYIDARYDFAFAPPAVLPGA